MVYVIKESFGINGKGKPLAFATSMNIAKEWLDTNFGIVCFEVDADGHDAADCMAKNGSLYVVEPE